MMLTFKKITSSQDLHDLYTKDKPAMKKNPSYDDELYGYGLNGPDGDEPFIPVLDYNEDITEMVAQHVCTKTLVFNKNGEVITTSAWFITRHENELIYDIEYNEWINLNLFDDNKSVCNDIYYVKDSHYTIDE